MQTCMTPARFHSFIKSVLRGASMKWPPINAVRKKARVRRGYYLCNGCKQVVPASIVVTLKNGKTKRVKNAIVDHIDPVIPPSGFTSWDEVVDRMFVDEEGLQLLCRACHEEKTKRETDERVLQRLSSV